MGFFSSLMTIINRVIGFDLKFSVPMPLLIASMMLNYIVRLQASLYTGFLCDVFFVLSTTLNTEKLKGDISA